MEIINYLKSFVITTGLHKNTLIGQILYILYNILKCHTEFGKSKKRKQRN